MSACPAHSCWSAGTDYEFLDEVNGVVPVAGKGAKKKAGGTKSAKATTPPKRPAGASVLSMEQFEGA